MMGDTESVRPERLPAGVEVKRCVILASLLLVAASVPAANLVLPAFAHNVDGADDVVWSSEIYLTNPSRQPVQVSLVKLLPGFVERPAPLGEGRTTSH